jgi:hypothetical protein
MHGSKRKPNHKQLSKLKAESVVWQEAADLKFQEQPPVDLQAHQDLEHLLEDLPEEEGFPQL